MHTNYKTLSSRSTKPACANHRVILTPISGVTTVLASASAVIAPRGNVSPERKRRQASAPPWHIKPIGTLAAPTKFAVSRIKVSGGWPSRRSGTAVGSCPTGAGKSALSGSTNAITTEMTISTGMGSDNSAKKCRERLACGSLFRGMSVTF